MYNLLKEEIAISDSVHRALNDAVNRMTDGSVSGWQDNYKIFLAPDGQIDARPTEQNHHGGFQSGLTCKLVFLPTPKWVQSKQKVYICFYYELAELMKDWWEEYAKLIC